MSPLQIQRIEVATPIASLRLAVARRSPHCWAYLFHRSKAGLDQMMIYVTCYRPAEVRVSRGCANGWTLWMGETAIEIASKDARRLAAFLDCRLEENAA